jgi:P2-related tail formation protein
MAEYAERLGAINISTVDTWTALLNTNGKRALISRIIVVNRNSGTSVNVKIAHTVGGTTVNNEDWLEPLENVLASDSKTARGPFTLGVDDRIMVQSDTTNVNFIAYGIWIQ